MYVERRAFPLDAVHTAPIWTQARLQRLNDVMGSHGHGKANRLNQLQTGAWFVLVDIR